MVPRLSTYGIVQLSYLCQAHWSKSRFNLPFSGISDIEHLFKCSKTQWKYNIYFIRLFWEVKEIMQAKCWTHHSVHSQHSINANLLKTKVSRFDLANSQLLLFKHEAHGRCWCVFPSPPLNPLDVLLPLLHIGGAAPVPLHSLTWALVTLPVEVLLSLILAEEAFQDGAGNGQHHGGGSRVAQPHGQEGGGHHHPQNEPGNRGS